MVKLPAGYYPDHYDANIYRYWDGAQWTAHTRSAPAPIVADARNANAYSTIAKVMGVLAVSCIVGIAFLIFTDVRAGGMNCGSVINSGSDSAIISSGDFWICRAARDSRETWSIILLGACLLFLIIDAVVGRAGDKVRQG